MHQFPIHALRQVATGALIALLPLCAVAQPEYSGRLPVGDRPMHYNIRKGEAREFTFILRKPGNYQVRVEQEHMNMVLYLKSEAGDTLRVSDAHWKRDGYHALHIHADTPVRYFLIAAAEPGIGDPLSGRFSIQVARLDERGEVVPEQEE